MMRRTVRTDLQLLCASIYPVTFKNKLPQTFLFALQAATEGHGVVMARLPLAESFLRDGRLVPAFDRKVRSRDCYYLLYPKAADQQKKVQVFRDWIVSEAAKSPYHLPNAREADT